MHLLPMGNWKIFAATLLVCPVLGALSCGDPTCANSNEPLLNDATSLIQLKGALNLGGNRSSMKDGTYCRRSSLRMRQYKYYCDFHLSDSDGMGTDGVTVHANEEKMHIAGVLSLKGQCTTLLTHSIQLFDKDLVEFGIRRVGKMTLEFAPDKANLACKCYTKAAQNLGFRKLTFDESGQAEGARRFQHSTRRKTNGFPLDCFAFPLGSSDSSGLRTIWTFTDRLDGDIQDTLNLNVKDIRAGREKIMDHAQYVVGGEPTEDIHTSADQAVAPVPIAL